MLPIELVRLIATQANHNFFIEGEYGFLRATAHPGHNKQTTYTIDSHYHHRDKDVLLDDQPNFRLSTVCCLCVGIVFGDKALNERLIRVINRIFP